MSRDELAVALEELAAAIRSLGAAVEDSPRQRALRTPSVSDVLRVTDELAIPALIAVLDAQIRTLKVLQRGSRLARRGRDVDTRIRSSTDAATNRRPDAAAIVDQMGETIAQIQQRLGESTDDETRALLERTRSMYEEIDRRIAAQETDATDRSIGYRIEIDDGTDETETIDSDGEDARHPDRASTAGDNVDVDAELQTLRDQYGTEADEGESPEADDDRPTTDADPGETAPEDDERPDGKADSASDGPADETGADDDSDGSDDSSESQ